MKNIIYILSALSILIFSSCEDVLDTNNLYTVNSVNYYKTPKQMQEALAGVYNALYVYSENSDEHLVSELLSDVVFGGGGSDDLAAKNIASFVDPLEDTHKSLWLQTYKGVARANAILEAVAQNDFSKSFNTQAEALEFKNKMLAEAHFMRGFLYFRAARLFGGMPLILTTVGPFNAGRSSIPETFGQIADDFLKASQLFPATNVNELPLSEYGHANKWVAKAYLARTYLHFCGYMTNIEKVPTNVVTLPGGSQLTKANVIQHLEDIQTNSGHELTPDFRNLWPYSHINTVAGKTVLPWAQTNNLQWVGQDGPKSKIGTGNKEVMFALRYANATWATTQVRNWFVLFCGVRKNSMIPFGEGWGWGTVHPQFYNSWDNNDMRKNGSVLKMGEADQATDTYSPNQGDHETGYFNKKYTPLQFVNEENKKVGIFNKLYNSGLSDFMLWHAQDFYYLRYSDVLLMHSELTETATGLNLVHRRAYGANHVDLPYTLENLKKERLNEFAFEGVRWFDLVRWGDVATSNSYFGVEADVVNEGIPARHVERYRTETKGLRPIPESEVRLSNGAYKQNPGW